MRLADMFTDHTMSLSLVAATQAVKPPLQQLDPVREPPL
jgi:hypothetical protein